MTKQIDPRIHIGIDNCFAIKRWTAPEDWARVVADLGMRYVEAVPDLECEPLLTPDDYRREWIDRVNKVRDRTGVQVVMFYSNDSTYDTIGFSHPDERVRRYFVEEWFGKFIDLAAGVGSDIGFYVQATDETALATREGREEAFARARGCMEDVCRMAAQAGIAHTAIEQMYTPHQPPFSIDGMEKLIRDVTAASGVPFYFTEDVGHHCPKYFMPDENVLKKAAERYAQDGFVDVWLGSPQAYSLFTAEAEKGTLSAAALHALQDDFEKNADQFNTPEDADCYEWLRRLGAWSPVIHMQQTDGTHSSHDPFTPANNAAGRIHPVKVLRAIADCYERGPKEGMPPQCSDIYLIQELYLSTKDIGYQGLYKLKQSTDYLRRFIPEDGLRLSELLSMNLAFTDEGAEG